jgi:hypothetical protein
MKVEHVVGQRGEIFIEFIHENREELSALQSVTIKSRVPGVGVIKSVYDSAYPELDPTPDEDDNESPVA